MWSKGTEFGIHRVYNKRKDAENEIYEPIDVSWWDNFFPHNIGARQRKPGMEHFVIIESIVY